MLTLLTERLGPLQSLDEDTLRRMAEYPKVKQGMQRKAWIARLKSIIGPVGGSSVGPTSSQLGSRTAVAMPTSGLLWFTDSIDSA